MAEIPLNALGSVGAVYDLEGHEIPPEGFSYVKNIDFSKNELRKALGYSEVYADTTPSHSQAPRWLLPWVTVTDNQWIYTGTTKAFLMDASTLTDITRSAGNYSATAASRWSGGILGGVPIVNNNAGDAPQSWDGSSKLQDLPNWPASVSCKVMRVHKTFLLALNVVKSGVNYPHMVKWPTPATPGSVPGTWDETDETNDAGEFDLAETPGHIVDGLSLGNVFMVYKENSTWGMQFIGGRRVFRLWPIFYSDGIFAVDCARAFRNKHFVLTRDDAIVHNGQSFESVMETRVRKALFRDIDEAYFDRTYVAHDINNSQMMVCYIASGTTSPTTANMSAIWNYQYNTWTFRELPNVAFIANGVVDNDATEGLAQIWDNIEDNWDDIETTWNERGYSPAKQRMLAAGTDDTKFYLMNEGNSADGAAISCVAQRTGLGIVGRDRLGNWMVDLVNQKFIRRVWPDVDSTSDVTFRIGFQDKKGGAITWYGPYTFTPSDDKYFDVMQQGRYICYEISQSSVASLTVHGMTFDIEVTGNSNF